MYIFTRITFFRRKYLFSRENVSNGKNIVNIFTKNKKVMKNNKKNNEK